ncbi:MAG: 2-phospho-L-lactate transferase [Methanoregulaceae archaeon PtaU1.Bin222]|nr:MAG: 2-phospho-L-lactate transferase [Methanoregulaceae archaeon PtaU1.Bin222]
MITFLSGGTGTPKLIRGARYHLPDEEICVVGNTAEDVWISGNFLSPDIDTLIYLFSGSLDTTTWWGLTGDTFHTHEEIVRLGGDEYVTIGDRDRAFHILRGDLLRRGMRLTEVTAQLCASLGVRARILPMADTSVTTVIRTAEREIHFQEFWVRYRGALPIEGVERRWNTPPVATPEVLSALQSAEGVIIGPSNPVTSILPILECEGIKEALMDVPVAAVSPFIGDAPVSGPAGILMRALGYSPDSHSTWKLYRDVTDFFIQDIRDPVEVPGAIRMDTLMNSQGVDSALAGAILSLIAGK